MTQRLVTQRPVTQRPVTQISRPARERQFFSPAGGPAGGDFCTPNFDLVAGVKCHFRTQEPP